MQSLHVAAHLLGVHIIIHTFVLERGKFVTYSHCISAYSAELLSAF